MRGFFAFLILDAAFSMPSLSPANLIGLASFVIGEDGGEKTVVSKETVFSNNPKGMSICTGPLLCLVLSNFPFFIVSGMLSIELIRFLQMVTSLYTAFWSNLYLLYPLL